MSNRNFKTINLKVYRLSRLSLGFSPYKVSTISILQLFQLLQLLKLKVIWKFKYSYKLNFQGI